MSTNQQKAPQGSPWAFRIATIAGIPVRIHFTFLFLLAYFGFMGEHTSGNWLLWVVFTLLLFLCVVLHEFGHALTARRFGIATRDITLYPMGGIAMFEGRMKPAQELWIALAGPLVNFAICVVLALYLIVSGTGIGWPTADLLGNGLITALFFSNAVLAVFNLIPAFPMDGGRVLRAMLGLVMPEARATAIAGTIGQVLAVVLGIVAFLSGNLLLAFICILIFLGAGQEMAATSTRSVLEGHFVRDAMQTRFRTLAHGATMQEAADQLLAGSQHAFPVLTGDDLAGILTRDDISRGLATEGPSGYVAAHMNREFASVPPELALDEAIDLLAADRGMPLMVIEGEKIVGMLTAENLSEFIMLQHALRQGYRRSV